MVAPAESRVESARRLRFCLGGNAPGAANCPHPLEERRSEEIGACVDVGLVATAPLVRVRMGIRSLRAHARQPEESHETGTAPTIASFLLLFATTLPLRER